MKCSRLLLTSAIVVFTASCGNDKASQDHDFYHEISDLKPDPAIVYGKLENGVRYGVMRNDTPTKTAALRVRIETGSLNENDDQRGLAHFLEHMAFNGSKNIPEGEMIKRLERFGLAFGADTNAYTSFDQTVYTLDLPEVSEEIFDESLMIMRETVENLTLDPEAIDRERGVVQSEKRNQDSPGAQASLNQLEFLTKGSRIFDRLPIGDDESLKTMQADSFRSYYQGYYRPENTVVVLVGDVETDYAQQKISQYFGDWQAVGDGLEQKDAGTASLRSMEVGYFSDPEIQTSMSLAVMRPYIEREDTISNRKAVFIEGLGNRILNRRLSSIARTADAPFISAGGGASSIFDTAELSILSVSTRPGNWKSGFAAADQELRKVLEFGFTQAELDEQLANSRKSMQVAVQTAETRRTSSLASGVLSSIANENVFTHPSTSLARFETYADDISVEQVWKHFKTQWNGADEPLLYLSTSVVLDDPQAEIRSAFENARAIPVVQDVAKDIGTFAYTEFGTPGKVIKEDHIEDVDAYLIRFENNVRLNFKKTDFEKESVRIRASIGDGSLSMPQKDAAMSILTSNMLSAGGLEAHSVDDIQRLMAGKAVSASLSAARRSFSLSGSTVPQDIEDEFNLLMASLIAPGFRDEAKARYDKYIESWYPTLDSTPGGVASRDVGKLVRSGDLRWGIPPQAALLEADPEAVKTWVKEQLKDGQIEISVVGDIDKDIIIQQVARTFGTLDTRKLTRGDYPDMTRLQFPAGTRNPVSLSHSGDDNRALLQVFWPAPDGTDIMRNRRLGVLRTIFSNKLLDVVREDEGAAYSPSAGRSGGRIFKGYGYLSASLGLTPETVPKMQKTLDMIAEDMRAGNFTDDEFNRAIKPVLENLDSSLESNSYWMGVISNAQDDQYGIKNFRTREDAYRNMKIDELKPLAADIFKSENAYRVQILPQK